MTTEIIGYWKIEVPLSPEEEQADRVILDQIKWPEGLTLKRCEVVVHGRVYEWDNITVGLWR